MTSLELVLAASGIILTLIGLLYHSILKKQQEVDKRLEKIELKQSQQMTKENVEDAIKRAVLELQISLTKIESDMHNMKNYISGTEGVQLQILEELKRLNKS